MYIPELSLDFKFIGSKMLFLARNVLFKVLVSNI